MSGKSENIIELKHISKVYSDNGFKAVDDFNLEVKRGEFVTFLGPSGCGKTTTLRMIAGFELPTDGQILLNGEDISQLPANKRPINTVFQRYALFPHMNIYENIAFAMKVVEAPSRQIKSRVLSMLSMVGLLDKYKAYPNELSGGEQQRVAIARALVNRPAILLCDEPTGNLDPANSAEIMKILNQANKLGTTVLVVTHNMEIVQQMKKRTITMSEGKIISDLEKGGYFYED